MVAALAGMSGVSGSSLRETQSINKRFGTAA